MARKPTRVETTRSNKRGSYKSATSGLRDYEPKNKIFRNTKTNKGVQFPQYRKPFP